MKIKGMWDTWLCPGLGGAERKENCRKSVGIIRGFVNIFRKYKK